ncbi:hypothetical protein DV515_00012531 [Chloebia gouldiae]|uniref:Uncharacterized protein n=1 Tax=Chloebia gouldiae TaxID=44316 RepID=A0A3L8S3R2_CHLGU|nr:hypothetical protein DV515_00012531 [Chloebia gouldiae]
MAAPSHPITHLWGLIPVFGQSHPGIVAGGVSPVGAARLSQGDDFPDEVADLLEGAIGIFPAVGNDGPGRREQAQGEPVGFGGPWADVGSAGLGEASLVSRLLVQLCSQGREQGENPLQECRLLAPSCGISVHFYKAMWDG